MNPRDLNFPESITEFRPAQVEAIEYSLTSSKRFTALGAPPGVGKSAVAYALSQLLGGRTVILTATLGLQEQYGLFDVYDIRGRGNYPCWSGGNCEDGGRLGCKEKLDCPYLCAFKAQNASECVVTSYAYWLQVTERPGFTLPDTLICDEAHLAVEWLSRALDFYITERECREAKLRFDPLPGEAIDEWQAKADAVRIAAEARLALVKATMRRDDKGLRDLKHAEGFVQRADRLTGIEQGNWVITRTEGNDVGRIWRFECVWPGRYRERLFRGVPRVILMSATMRPKTLGLLGIKATDYDFKEWGRQFPARNGPVIWVPTVRLNHRMSSEDEKRWIERVDEILSKRSDRKGLVHTVSYARAKRLGEALGTNGHGKRLILNGAADPESQTAREAFERHCRAGADSVLVSPSFSTGWDFAGKAAEYQIIAKLPIPDSRSKVMQARCEWDRGYTDYLAAQELVQACGRVQRSYEDRGETLLIDDGWNWFRGKAAEYLPKWFNVRKEEEVPKALELLEE